MEAKVTTIGMLIKLCWVEICRVLARGIFCAVFFACFLGNVDQVVFGGNMQSGCQRHWCIGKANENDLLTLVHLFQFPSLFSFPFTFLKKAYTHSAAF